MAITATYDPVLSRIRLSATLLGATATYAVFERTTNGFINSATVRGGSSVVVTTQNASLSDYEFPAGIATTYRVTSYNVSNVQQATFSVAITQDLTQAWLKVPAGPFLNQPVTVVDRSEINRKSRRTLFDVVGRTLPVMVGDVAGSLAYTLQLLTATAAAERNLDYLFASGEVVFLQLPSTVQHIPGGYFAVGDVYRLPTIRLSPRRVWTVPLTEVAQPGTSVVSTAYTISSMLAEYATISAVMAGNATIALLLDRTGTPSDVIVG
jgi:hypothetical protein